MQNEIKNRLFSSDITRLVPEAVVKVAKNPDQLEVISLIEGDDEINLIIVEHNYENLTDEQEWLEWIDAVESAEEESSSGITFWPDPPSEVNRLHAKFITDIKNGRFSLTDRILLTCRIKIHEGSNKMLLVEDYDGEKGLGIAKDFYTNVLPHLAGEIGLRFIIGYNDETNTGFFTQKIGRYTCEQLKTEAKEKFFPEINPNSEKFTTIQFLHDSDVRRYVQEGEIKSN